MKINIKQLKIWIAALDSGKYTQTQHSLHDSYGYCCLGVACAVLIPKIKHKTILDTDTLSGTVPRDQPHAPVWLTQISMDFFRKTEKSLVELNDQDCFTFAEIATLLELVYIHKILD